MYKLQILGHVHLTADGQPVPLSAKAHALLTYLTLERGSHHREFIADLLWDTPEALANLRVELTRLRQKRLPFFPARTPMLHVNCPTDLHTWLQEADHVSDDAVPQWLAALRGTPLSGLEDLGSAEFRDWVELQRQHLGTHLERALGRVYTRLAQAGHTTHLDLIRARADRLGLDLTASTPTPAPSPTSAAPVALPSALAPLHAALIGAANAARHAPQLLLLGARLGSGERQHLDATFSGTEWSVIHMHANSSPLLFMTALTHQLARLCPPELQERLLGAVGGGSHQHDLQRVASLFTAARRPLVLVIHTPQPDQTLVNDGVRFALELPVPLLIVLTATSALGLDALRDALGPMDLSRVHRVDVPPLSVRDVRAMLEARGSAHDPDALHARAARINQQAEGWPLHVEALMDGPDPRLRLPLPPVVRDTLLGDLAHQTPRLRRHLALWSLVYSSLNAELADELTRTLGGDGGLDTFAQAVALGLLQQATPQETLRLDTFTYRTSDLDTHFGFAHEPLRTALAGTLTSSERRELRAHLARHYLSTHPALARLYAEHAGLTDLAAQARAALPPAEVPQAHAAPHQLTPPPRPRDTARRETRTPNGYRVALDGGHLEVSRYGRYAPAPTLRLSGPPVRGGAWHLTARIDAFSSAPDLEGAPHMYPLALRTAPDARVVYSTQPFAPFTEDGVTHTFGGLVPEGRWFTLSGHGDPGTLELTVRALDVALSVAQFTWSGADVL
ncbi:transcriptional regulator domain-containing protein [Deinococcus maricopensis]|uniref:Transcriptional regulator domain-containing protein n=1 Tax=Deinococcus maricopensis (strain DSM 21211 / LMG 22137 / NRRL B-23946 / LB-34) TaxID=709986 RepID=E8U742_DEIML|nr:transcriptional regulator domain-containing protein [Deinococcus maricopensis]ADV66881.1 transcriptional regulator domain-containing protein [Deinococcus maricopensis DSM 21211]